MGRFGFCKGSGRDFDLALCCRVVELYKHFSGFNPVALFDVQGLHNAPLQGSQIGPCGGKQLA